MLQHLGLVEGPGGTQPLPVDIAAQEENFLYFHKLLGDIESVFGRLSSGLATLHAGVQELAREKEALPVRKTGKPDKPKARPRLACSAQRLLARSAGRASGF